MYQAGETLRLTATITDSAGDPATPTSVTISIKKADGTLDITDTAMSSTVAGTYYYDYAIPSDIGIYYAAVTATGSAGRVTILPDTFTVGDAI
jgi:uncharacterized protein YfaS (alpha-2-macroglobulin family)